MPRNKKKSIKKVSGYNNDPYANGVVGAFNEDHMNTAFISHKIHSFVQAMN
jgi:hypothetical protein